MQEYLNFLISFTTGQDPLLRTLGTLVILIAGHLTVKTIALITRKLWITRGTELTKKSIEKRHKVIQHATYFLDAIIIAIGLLYLNMGLPAEITTEMIEYMPRLLTVILVGILGIIGINLATNFGTRTLAKLGIRNYFREIGLSENALQLISLFIKGFLYLIVLQIVLTHIGVGDTFINEAINASSYAAVFLIAALVFWGFKDLFENIAAGLYLKSSRVVRPGEKIYLDDESGKLRGIDLFSTELETDSGYTLVTQNKEIMDADLKFKRSKSDIHTLEDVKKYFVAQDPSFCGPASAEMALSIFGYKESQEKIGELSGAKEGRGVPPEDVDKLMKSVETLTEGEVKAAYVDYDKITDLADEFKVWLNDDALIIPHFAKTYLFPQSETAHYSLCVGVEGEELLIVDPSADTVSGGVYYAEASEMLEAMGEYEGKTRGYIVLAPEDTTAYWRIERGLIYSDKSFYDEISKNMELQLRRILRQGRILKNVLPEQLQDYLNKWEKEENVSRIWKPKSERKERSTEKDQENNEE